MKTNICKSMLMLISLGSFIGSINAQNKVNPFNIKGANKTVIAQSVKGASLQMVNTSGKSYSSAKGVFDLTLNSAQIVKENGLPIMIKERIKAGSLYKANTANNSLLSVIAYLNKYKTIMQIQNPEAEFIVNNIANDDLNQTHIKMNQFYKGIPVYGSEIILHTYHNVIHLLNGRYYPTPILPKISPSILQSVAVVNAVNDLKTHTFYRELNNEEQALMKYNQPNAELVIYHKDRNPSNEKLVWHISVRSNFIELWDYFIDAHTGEVIHKFNHTCTIDGPKTTSANDLHGISRTVNSYQKGSTYYMIDASRTMYKASQSTFPNNPVGVIWTRDAQNSDGSSIANVTSSNNSWNSKSVSAHYNSGIAYEYYKTTHNRNSINGQGGNIVSIINVSDENGQGLDNAYWNGEAMFYGNGDVAFKPLARSLDVAGHEMTHGVVQNTANLEYETQSGAINESMADIFGCMMDRNDWLIGEDVVETAYFPSGALRSLQDPHNGGSEGDNGWQPKNMSEYYSGEEDNGGVHINSGIVNYAFYLFATNLNKEKAEQIYYKALSQYLTKNSQFIDLRIAIIEAATSLYGVSSAEVTAAASAFDAVGIYGDDQQTGSNNTAVDLPINPGQDYLLSYDLNASDQTTLYSSSTVGNSFSAKSTTEFKRKPSVSDDGSECVFVSTDSKIRSLNLIGSPNENILANQAIWDNVVISKDGTKIAAVTTSIDSSIYVYDYGTQVWKTFKLYNPTYTQGVNAGGVLYADALEWDYTGEYLIYDAENVVGDVDYWDVGIINVWDNSLNTWGSGKVEKLFTQLPEGISIGNPTFAKNSPYIIAFDYIDTNDDSYAILTKNTITGDIGTITANTKLGFPCYSKLDNKMVYDAEDNNGDDVIAVISLNQNKMEGSGNPTVLVSEAQWGVWYTQGTRNLLSSEKDILSFGFPGLAPPVTCIINGNNITTTVPSNTDLSALTAYFSVSPFAEVKIGSTNQTSGVTPNNFITPLVYNVRAQDGTTKNYTVTVTIVTGTIENENKENDIIVYPNPAKDILIINANQNMDYEVYDMLGNIIRKGKRMNNEVINIQDISQGVYLLKLQTDNSMVYKKFLKE